MSNAPDKGFSFSVITDYLTCPRYFKLKHIDKVLPYESSLDAECGTALHLGINDILSGEGDGIEVSLMYWDSLKHADLKRFSFGPEELRNCLEVWLRKFTKNHAKHFRPVMMEERQYGQIGGHGFQGTPDFVGYYKDTPCVFDWKTTTARYDKRKVLVDEQMMGYVKLVRDTLGFEAKIIGYLPFVKHREDPSIQNPSIKQLTEYCISDTVVNMKAQMSAIQADESFYKNTRSCVRGTIICPAFEKCHGKGEE